jgi:hypothetical protein
MSPPPRWSRFVFSFRDPPCVACCSSLVAWHGTFGLSPPARQRQGTEADGAF